MKPSYHLRDLGFVVHSLESSRQFIHGGPVMLTSQRTFRALQNRHACLALLLTTFCELDLSLVRLGADMTGISVCATKHW